MKMTGYSNEEIQRMMGFSAEEMQRFVEQPKEPEKPVCPFFLKGKCKYGDRCWLGHPSGEEFAVEGDMECGICLHKIRENHKEFGLLLGCSHSFCLNCMRVWRGQVNVPKEVARSCPICRTTSFYIIPSPVFVEGYEEKMNMANQYKQKLGGIPCRFFNFGEGECPFSSSCFYDHRYKNGEKWTPPALIMEINEYGEKGVAKNPKLSDLLNL